MRGALVVAAAMLAGCQPSAQGKMEASARPSQSTQAGVRANLYQCEGCDGVFEADAASLTNHARIGPGIDEGEPMTITGTVYQADRRTPAPGVIVYAYHTNAAGVYGNGTPETEWSRRHGRLRGWIKTGADGSYRFDTIKPAPYPDRDVPAHVHLTVLEPGKRPYWIDDIVFDGEFGVTPAYRRSMTNQGGNGIVPVSHNRQGEAQVNRDIILERHPA